jgi:long-chain acyl-CoA synthetase
VIQESPYIQQAVVVGDNQDALGLLLVTDPQALHQLAVSRKINWANDHDLLGSPAVYRFFQEEVQSRLVNNGILFPGGKAARIALLPSLFEVGRELTQTLNKRREVISEMYRGVIDRLYHP